jgi:DNA polymerase-4
MYLDITGSARLFGPGRDAALKLERDLDKRLSLAGSVGVAGNKLVSKIAAGYLHKPGICDVLRGSESQFIAPLPVTVIPGIGEARQRILLADLNLSLVGQVASLTLPQLTLPFGPFAPLFFHRARGIDPSPVLPPRRMPEVSCESLLDGEGNDDPVLLGELYRLVEECGLRLRTTGKAAARLTLTITHSDGLSRRRTVSVKDPVDKDARIFTLVEELFYQASERRVGIKWMNLVCDGLCSPRGQLDMFMDPAASDGKDSLQEALDAVRGRYGMGAVKRGRTMTAGSVQRSTFNVQRSRSGAQGAGRRSVDSDLRSQISDLKSSGPKNSGRH